MTRMYLPDHAPDDPRVSPLMARFEGAPPVWITAAKTEILRDDARRMAARLERFGTDVTYREEGDLPHVWPIMSDMLPEGRQTLAEIADWIRQLPGWQGGS
jgi:acetyl esterase/lipase